MRLSTISRGFAIGLLLGVALLLFPGGAAFMVRSVEKLLTLSSYVSSNHATGNADDYRLALLGVSGSTIYSVTAVIGSLLLFGLYLGIVQAATRPLRVDRGTILVVATCLALIALVGSSGRLAHMAALLYGLAFGVVGTFLGAAAAGRALVEGFLPGIVLGGLAFLDAIVFAFAPLAGELQLILAVLLVFNGILSFRDLRREAAYQGPVLALLVSPPLILFSVMSAVLVLPVLVPGWGYYQLGLLLLGALAGPALRLGR